MRSRRRTKGFLFMLALLLYLGALGSHQVLSHPRADFYGRWWQGDLTPEWHFDSSFPNIDSYRKAVKDGAIEWNAIDSPMGFNKEPGDINVAYGGCPDDVTRNGIHWQAIDGTGGFLASARSCGWDGDPNRMETFQIRFDSQESWYIGAGDPADYLIDLWSVATHEFGHATGFGLADAPYVHFLSGSNACVDAPRQTMCPSIAKGERHWRSVETHDIHTFQNRYP